MKELVYKCDQCGLSIESRDIRLLVEEDRSRKIYISPIFLKASKVPPDAIMFPTETYDYHLCKSCMTLVLQGVINHIQDW